MKNWINRKAQYYIEGSKNRMQNMKAHTALCLAILMVTSYILMIPAMAMNQEHKVGVVQEKEENKIWVISGKQEKDTNVSKDDNQSVAQSITSMVRRADTQSPLTLDSYINKYTLSYQDKSGKWIVATGKEKDIPANAKVKIEVGYEKVPINKLLASNCSLKYDMPHILKSPQATGAINYGTQKVGEVQANKENNSATLVLDKAWLEQQQKENNSMVSGRFYITAQFDYKEIKEDIPEEFKVGSVDIKLDFEDDIIAKYGEIKTTKSRGTLETGEDGSYLNYKLTVSVPKDGSAIPDVKIVDSFTSKDYIDYYVGVNGYETSTTKIDAVKETHPDKTTAGKVYIGGDTKNDTIPGPLKDKMQRPGTLVWSIGNMNPGEVRTLEYKVKIKDKYIGSAIKTSLVNKAKTYSETYKRDDDIANYNPNVKVNIWKDIYDYEKTEDGKLKIRYKLRVVADGNNSYTLTNLRVEDKLDSGVLREHGSYVKDSFVLYKGNEISKTGIKINADITEGDGNSTSPSFSLNIGDLEKGKTKTIIYEVEINDPKEVEKIEAKGQSAKFSNLAYVYPDKEKNPESGPLCSDEDDKWKCVKRWERKMLGDKLTDKKVITLGKNNVYSEQIESGKTQIKPEDNPSNSFEVPKGAYEYNVIVNEAGDWNLSSTVLKDKFYPLHLKYSGYLKVSAYKTDKSELINKVNDYVLDEFKKLTPVKTAWLKVDGETEFSFKPNQLGLDGKYAYVLNYYAVPNDIDKIEKVNVKNTFETGGTGIGPSGESYTVEGIKVQADVVITGGINYSANKTGWYSTSAEKETNYKNGALYWAIELKGDIPQDLQVKDMAYSNNKGLQNIQRIYDDAVVGAFVSTKALKDVKDVEALKKDESFRTLIGNSMSTDKTPDNADYTWERNDNNNLKLVFKKSTKLQNDETLYIIVKTAIDSVEGKPTHYEATNGLKTGITDKEVGDSKTIVATMDIVQNEGVEKIAQGVYNYDGTTIKNINGATTNDILKKDNDPKKIGIEKPGTYLSWLVHINSSGKMPSSAVLRDILPAGTELSYVRFYKLPQLYKTQDKLDTDIEALKNDKNWEKIQNTAPLSGSSAGRQCTYYYNKSNNEVQWAVNGIKNSEEYNAASMDFQVVVRVTDQDTILGKEETFNNTLIVTANGNKYEDSAPIKVKVQTLKKVSTYDPSYAGIYPFMITVNPLGEDLMSRSDKITLIDQINDVLEFNPGSLKVVNSKTGENITVAPKMDSTGKIMRIDIPDNIPIKITYDTFVNASPGQKVNIENTAHWEGYEPATSSVVKKENFSYSVGGVVDVSSSPKFILTKVDTDNTNQKIAGVKFTLQEFEVVEDVLQPVDPQRVYERTTDAEGRIIVSENDGDSWFQFNKIYCLKETEAPSGYVLSDEPYYFVISKAETKKDGTKVERQYPDGVFEWSSSSVYAYTAYNAKIKVKVEKKFEDIDGNSMPAPDGTYHFGIYEDGDTSKLQDLTIEYKDGKPKNTETYFTNLELNKSYCIYELDEDGNPVSEGSSVTVNGKLYTVNYAKNRVAIGDGKEVPVVGVTNRIKGGPMMPETGGTGVYRYMSAGLLLMLMAMLMYYIYFIREKEGGCRAS